MAGTNEEGQNNTWYVDHQFRHSNDRAGAKMHCKVMPAMFLPWCLSRQIWRYLEGRCHQKYRPAMLAAAGLCKHKAMSVFPFSFFWKKK